MENGGIASSITRPLERKLSTEASNLIYISRSYTDLGVKCALRHILKYVVSVGILMRSLMRSGSVVARGNLNRFLDVVFVETREVRLPIR